MKRRSEILPWDALNKKAFWDRDVPLATWRQGVQEGQRSYLPGAVAAFDPVEFIHYDGVDAFKADWPRLRQSVEAGAVHRLPLFDLAWSRLVSETWTVPPDERIASLLARKRDFLVTRLVYQIDAGCTRLLWVGQARTKQSFEKFFTLIGEQLAGKIEFVCSCRFPFKLSLLIFQLAPLTLSSCH